MLPVSRATRVFLRAGPTDMRRGFEGLFALAQEALRQDPLSGHLFVFCSRRRNRLKILFWDGTGLWVCAKRLERGRITWPQSANEEVDLPRLHALVAGLDFSPKKNWFRR